MNPAGPIDATVVIPCYARADGLRGTLEALARVTFPHERWEVVVVDDGSSVPVREQLEGWLPTLSLPNLRWERQDNAGPARARTRGAEVARGRCVIFIDDDCVVPPGFVEAHVAAHDAGPRLLVVGGVDNPPQMRDTPFGRFRDDRMRAGAAAAGETIYNVSTQNFSVDRAEFLALGGFDSGFRTASGEDWEYALRATDAGHRIVVRPDIRVVHMDWVDSLDRCCLRQFNYSVADVGFWRKHGDRCPRVVLVTSNGPWMPGDSPRMRAQKVVKSILATAPVRAAVRALVGMVERVAPDSALSKRGYDLLIGIAIFRGVRHGFAQSPARQG